MRYLVLVCILLSIGCDTNTNQDHEKRPRRERHERRRRDVPAPDDQHKLDDLAKPKIAGEITDAQIAQITGRALGMRELAKQARDGAVKDVWDVQKVFLDIDRRTREEFDKALGSRLEKELKQPTSDALPSNAEAVFSKIADEFDAVLKGN